MNLFSKLLLGLDTKAFRSGIANADRSLKKFSGQLKNIGGLIGATFAGSQIISFTRNAVELGSQLEKASAGFARFGTEADLEKLRNQTRGLVSDVQLMQKTVMGANLGIPFKDMGILLEFAKRRADETGESLDNLISSIVEGVGRKSTRRLDNLGISADRLKEKVGGVSLEMASVADVSRAMVDIANEELAKMGPALNTATDEVEKLRVEWENMTASFGVTIAPTVTAALKAITRGAQAAFAMPSNSWLNIVMGLATGNFNPERQPTMPGAPNATAPRDPNAPLDYAPTAMASPFGVYAPSPDTLNSMQEALKALKDQYQAVDINSAAFSQLRSEIEKLEQQIKDVTDGVVPQTEAINLQAKATNDVYQAQERSLMIMRQIPAAGNAYTEWVKDITASYEKWNQEIMTMNYIGQEFGNILTASFQAALTNGESFFDTIKKGFRNYITQIAAMTAATTALALAVAFVTGGANFKAAFNNIGGGMGLPFGFDDTGELKFRIAGFGMEASNNRNQRGLNILGN